MSVPVDRSDFEPLRARAAAALAQGQMDEAAPLLAQLAAIDAQNPRLRELQQWAAVLAFDWPAARIDATPKTGAPPDDDMVDIVLFHADPPPARREPSGYIALAAMAFEAAAARAPQARRILLTDKTTPVPPSVGAHQVVRQDLDHRRLMYERMRVQRKYLKSRAPGRVSVLADVDVVTNRNPAGIFAEQFDIGLTWRGEFPNMPFNGGVLFAGKGVRAVAFFDMALKCYDALAADPAVTALFESDLRHWWGDQFVLAVLAGYRQFARRTSEAAMIDDVTVRFFPCEMYNFAPAPGTNYNLQDLAARHFMHFKGPRKTSLPQYIKLMRAGKV